MPTRATARRGLPVTPVAHHAAHASALAGEHPEVSRWLVFTWDGVGLGPDGTLWGGEALAGAPGRWRRVASLRPFRLPGGERAAREPWRSAQALCWAAGQPWQAPDQDPAALQLLRQAWARGLNSPVTSAAGRLFDAASALLGLVQMTSFEGQGPQWLEAVAAPARAAAPLPLNRTDGVWQADWAPLLPGLLDAARPLAERAGAFHDALAATVVAQARAVARDHPVEAVGLCGGVFQNRRLTETVAAGLAAEGLALRLPGEVPGNDAGLSFGQLVEAAHGR